MRLHVHAWGDASAPPIVCLHGVQAHGRRFRKLAEERLARHHRVLAPDLRGHGSSPWDEPWTLEAHVSDVLDTIPERAIWLGHSFGGRLAMEALAREPERVERAVLLDPTMHVPQEFALYFAEGEREDRSYASVEEAVAERLGAGDLVSTPEEILEEEMHEHLARGDDGRWRLRYSRPCVAAAYFEMVAEPPPFARLRVPTLLVVGDRSKFTGAGEVERYRQELGDLLEVVVVPGGHMVYWDAFQETAAAIEAFLAR